MSDLSPISEAVPRELQPKTDHDIKTKRQPFRIIGSKAGETSNAEEHTEEENETTSKKETGKELKERQQESKTDKQAETTDTSQLKDYPKLFEKYQEKFNKVYTISQKLFNLEKAQRQTLYYYQRRNNAILDLLDKLEGDQTSLNKNEILDEADKLRIENVISLNPKLAKTLAPFLNDFEDYDLSKNHQLNLLINEIVPELINDDLKNYEINPQDIESWCRRHYPNLVISKFKPINLRSVGLDFNEKDTNNPHNGTNLINNRSKHVINKKKRKLNDNENDESVKKKSK